jgi:uncharacterized protein
MIVRSLRRVRSAIALLPVLLLIAAAAHAALTFPSLTGRVVDAAHILNGDTVRRLDGLLAAHEQKSGQQVVVVTLPSLQGTTIEDYGYQLGRHWGIGQKEKNTGALLIVAPKERKVRIEVGYGLEGTLTDARSSIIIQQIILPWFRQGRMDQGIVAGAVAVLSTLEGRAVSADRAAPQQARRGTSGADWTWLIPLVLFGVFWLGARPMMMGYPPGYRRRGPWSRSGPWIIPGGGGFGGGGFGGGGSGGGFSGGGGSFGGGGASGSW